MSNHLFPRPFPELDCDGLDVDGLTLRRAVGKMVSFGQQVGVTPEEMILLLDSGMSVKGLLYYLASQEPRVN